MRPFPTVLCLSLSVHRIGLEKVTGITINAEVSAGTDVFVNHTSARIIKDATGVAFTTDSNGLKKSLKNVFL